MRKAGVESMALMARRVKQDTLDYLAAKALPDSTELKARLDRREILVLLDPREQRGSLGMMESLADRGFLATLERRELLGTEVSLDQLERLVMRALRVRMVLLENGAAMGREDPQARRATVGREDSRESQDHLVTKGGKDPSVHLATRVTLDLQDPKATGEMMAPPAMRVQRDCLEHLGCLGTLG